MEWRSLQERNRNRTFQIVSLKAFFLTETKRRENKKPTEAVSRVVMGWDTYLPTQPSSYMTQFIF